MKYLRINLDSLDANFLFLCAGIRYCMGRHSYANAVGLDFVKRYWDKFSKKQRDELRGIIQSEINIYKYELDGKMEIQLWVDFLEENK